MSPSPRIYIAALSLAACSNNSTPRAALAASARPAAEPAPVAAARPEVAPAPVAVTDPECRGDGDCAPTTCCGPTSADTCATRADAPANCASVECPAPRGPVYRCACRAGRCVGVR